MHISYVKPQKGQFGVGLLSLMRVCESPAMDIPRRLASGIPDARLALVEGDTGGLSERDATDFSLDAQVRDLEAIVDQLARIPVSNASGEGRRPVLRGARRHENGRVYEEPLGADACRDADPDGG